LKPIKSVRIVYAWYQDYWSQYSKKGYYQG
jgi:hypothetical protein